MDTKTCCGQCFESSRDILRGPDYMLTEASPEGCNNENCPCHSQDTPLYRASEKEVKRFSEAYKVALPDTGWEKEFDTTDLKDMDYGCEGSDVCCGLCGGNNLTEHKVKSFITNLLASEREQLATAVEGMSYVEKVADLELPIDLLAYNRAIKQAAAFIRHSPNK